MLLKSFVFHFISKGINETIEMVEECGGFCKGYVVDISKKEEVYKAAEVITHEIGDVSWLFLWLFYIVFRFVKKPLTCVL